METRRIVINYTEYTNKSEMPADEAALLARAEEMTASSYAPYSNFHVGAAVLMSNGEVFGGSNQENAAFPSGLCAERTAIYYASAQCPDEAVVAVAIAAEYKGKPTEDVPSPCGACRQVLLEAEQRAKNAIEVLLYGTDGVYIIRSIKDLLPLSFDESFL